MHDLIQISKQIFSNSEQHAVNARELHGFLEVRTKFIDWIKKRITEYGFVENQDYTRIELKAGFQAATTGGGLDEILTSQKKEALKSTTYDFGQQGRVEYFVSLDMAKELAMVERNPKGKQARLYFIECEKRLSGSLKPAIDFTDPIAAAQAFIEAETERRQLAAQVAEIAPKAAALDLISAKQGDLCLTDTAKTLGIKLKDLTAYLQQNGWIYKRLGSSWIAYQDKINGGFLRHVEHEYSEGRIATQVRVTAKGLTVLAGRLTQAA